MAAGGTFAVIKHTAVADARYSNASIPPDPAASAGPGKVSWVGQEGGKPGKEGARIRAGREVPEGVDLAAWQGHTGFYPLHLEAQLGLASAKELVGERLMERHREIIPLSPPQPLDLPYLTI